MSKVSYDTKYGPAKVRFRFSRHGDCGQCRGTGTMEEYRYTNGGQCWKCHGTGGKRPPEGVYRVYRLPNWRDQMDGDTDPTFLGAVTKLKRGWKTSRTSLGEYPTRDAAALALHLVEATT